MTAEIEYTSAAQIAARAEQRKPPVEAITEGLWCIPVPIAFQPTHFTLCYAIALDEGLAVIDPGWDTDEAWNALAHGIRAIGFDVQDIRVALVTHSHRDHYGQTGLLRSRFGSRIALHPAEADVIVRRYGDPAAWRRELELVARRQGIPHERVREILASNHTPTDQLWKGAPDILVDGDWQLPTATGVLRAIWTPGHSPGHLCFFHEGYRMLFAGDHLLPKISPNISVRCATDENPLKDFLGSLARLADFDVTEVLPGHEARFRGHMARVDALADHHERRCREIEAALARRPGSTCWDVNSELTWRSAWSEFSSFEHRASLGETLAHLEYLRGSRRVMRSQNSAGAMQWAPHLPRNIRADD